MAELIQLADRVRGNQQSVGDLLVENNSLLRQNGAVLDKAAFTLENILDTAKLQLGIDQENQRLNALRLENEQLAAEEARREARRQEQLDRQAQAGATAAPSAGQQDSGGMGVSDALLAGGLGVGAGAAAGAAAARGSRMRSAAGAVARRLLKGGLIGLIASEFGQDISDQLAKEAEFLGDELNLPPNITEQISRSIQDSGTGAMYGAAIGAMFKRTIPGAVIGFMLSELSKDPETGERSAEQIGENLTNIINKIRNGEELTEQEMTNALGAAGVTAYAIYQAQRAARAAGTYVSKKMDTDAAARGPSAAPETTTKINEIEAKNAELTERVATLESEIDRAQAAPDAPRLDDPSVERAPSPDTTTVRPPTATTQVPELRTFSTSLTDADVARMGYARDAQGVIRQPAGAVGPSGESIGGRVVSLENLRRAAADAGIVVRPPKGQVPAGFNPNTVPNIKFRGLYNGLMKVAPYLTKAFTVYDIYRIYSIWEYGEDPLFPIADDNRKMVSEDDKIASTAAVLAGYFTALGGAAIGAIGGAFVGGPWGGFFGGLAGGVVGAISGEFLAYYIVMAILNKPTPNLPAQPGTEEYYQELRNKFSGFDRILPQPSIDEQDFQDIEEYLNRLDQQSSSLDSGSYLSRRFASAESGSSFVGDGVQTASTGNIDLATLNAAQATATPMTLQDGITQAARALGIDPSVLATAISYETAGSMDPLKRGPTTKYGQHRGLIQFGEPQARKYGVDFSSREAAIRSQLGANGAIVKYLRDHGVRPGMGLLEVYSAINAGGVGESFYGMSDVAAGGVPGTVLEKVQSQMMAEHIAAANEFMGTDTAIAGGRGTVVEPSGERQGASLMESFLSGDYGQILATGGIQGLASVMQSSVQRMQQRLKNTTVSDRSLSMSQMSNNQSNKNPVVVVDNSTNVQGGDGGGATQSAPSTAFRRPIDETLGGVFRNMYDSMFVG